MTATGAPTQALLALRPAAVFDGNDLVPDPTVLVDRGRILAVEPARIELPDRADVVDLPGTTLIPGLVDTHVHLAFDAGPDVEAALRARDDDAALRAMAVAARDQLRAGVTTVRDLGDRDFLALRLRDEGVGSGSFGPMPTIVASGPPLTTAGGHCHFLGGATSGVAGVRAAVAERAERGADVVKVMASGGFLTPGTPVDQAQFTPQELAAVVDEAHRRGLPVTAHAHSTAAIADALDAGVDGIEHCSFLTVDGVHAPAELLERIARRRVVVGATLGFLPGLTPPPAIAALIDEIMGVLSRLHEAGAPIVAGSDAGIGAPKPHGVLPHAVHQLEQLGFTTAQALRTLTIEAARVCGFGSSKGRIAPGYDADLVAVRGDPLRDPSSLHRIAAVYVSGDPVPLEERR